MKKARHRPSVRDVLKFGTGDLTNSSELTHMFTGSSFRIMVGQLPLREGARALHCSELPHSLAV